MAYGIARWIAGHHAPAANLNEPTLQVTNGVLHASELPNKTSTYFLSGTVPYPYGFSDPFSMGMVLFFSPAYTAPGSGLISMAGRFYRYPHAFGVTTSDLIITAAVDMSTVPEYTVFQYSAVYDHTLGFFPIGPGDPFTYNFEFGGGPGNGTGLHVLGLDLWVA